jgi:ribulose-5-phosphate 4-epimerase/fuculose-1-phosphate aldolase
MTTNLDNSIETVIRAVADTWRVLGSLGLVDMIFNHISAAVPNTSGDIQLVMNPEGMLPQEFRPENARVFPLRRYSPSEAEHLGVNPDGLMLHSALHMLRMKPGVIIHTHATYSLAVGCTEQGLLPLSQTAIEFAGELELVRYEGTFRSQLEAGILNNVATRGGVALMRNHGSLVVADNAAEALYVVYYLEEACRIQVITLSQGVSVVPPNEAAIANAHRVLRSDRAHSAERLLQALRRNLNT